MVLAACSSFKPLPEKLSVFPQVMKQPGETRFLFRSECAGEACGTLGHTPEVLFKRL
jgi:hypothetical protein